MKHPSKRLGAKGIDQIKKHPWFMKTSWEALKKKLLKAPYKNLVNKQRGRETDDNGSDSHELYGKLTNGNYSNIFYIYFNELIFGLNQITKFYF